MALNIETAIAWMKSKQGKVTYSMDFRDGPNSYDCSSSVYYALRSAGATSAGWAVNTEYEHDWLKKNGYELIAENTPWDAQRGDIFIWGRRGYSSGAGGHTGMFVDSENIIHCNYARNGITINNHDSIWNSAGQPYFYAYRPNSQETNVADKQYKTGWNRNSVGWWYINQDGTYPTNKWAKIDNVWYSFDNSGYARTSTWFKENENWYYLLPNGAMATGWALIDNSWYYFKDDGVMATGWIKYKDTWYFLDYKQGFMVSNAFIQSGNGWYYLKSDGTMADKPEFTVEPDGLITTK